MSADTILQHLDKVRATGAGKWLACCPAHDDRSPSLSIREASNGKTLIHCFAGCTAQEVIESVGLQTTDLFPPREPNIHRSRPKPPPIHWSEVFDAIETDLLTIGIAGRYIADGNEFSKEDGAEIEKRALHLVTVIQEVRNGRI